MPHNPVKLVRLVHRTSSLSLDNTVALHVSSFDEHETNELHTVPTRSNSNETNHRLVQCCLLNARSIVNKLNEFYLQLDVFHNRIMVV